MMSLERALTSLQFRTDMKYEDGGLVSQEFEFLEVDNLQKGLYVRSDLRRKKSILITTLL